MTDTAAPTAVAPQGEFRTLPLSTVHPSPTNPRDGARRKKSKKWAEFANSVKQQGVMQPIVVRPWPEHYTHATATRPEWEIIAGEGRYDASVEAGFAEIPAMIRTQLTDKQVVELQMIENIQREDLTPLEEADGLRRMIEEHGHTVDTAAATLECSKGRIYQHLKLLSLGAVGRAFLADGDIDFATAVAIARIPVAALQDQAAREIAKTPEGHAMSNREAVRHIQERYMISLKGAVFDLKDATLLPDAGNCMACPKRSGNNTDPTVEVRDVNVCTDPDCFRDKRHAHNKRRMAEAQQAGHKVVTGKAAEKLLPYPNRDFINDSKLEALDRKNYDQEFYGAVKKQEYPTNRELLAKAEEAGVEIKVTLIEHKASDTLVEAVDGKALAAALAKAGVLKKAKSTSSEEAARDHQREAEKKARNETEYRKRLHAEIRNAADEALAAGKASQDDWRLFTRRAWSNTHYDTQRRVIDFWVPLEPGEKKSEPHARIAKLTERIGDMAMNELYILMLDMALAAGCHVGSYDSQPTKLPEQYIELAGRYGVDPAAVRKAYNAEQKAKEKPAKKAPSVSLKGLMKAEEPAKATAKPAKAAAKKSASTPAPAAQAEKAKAPPKDNPIFPYAAGDCVRVKAGPHAGERGKIERFTSHARKGWIYFVRINAWPDKAVKLHHSALEPIDDDTEAQPAAQAQVSKLAPPLNPVAAWPFPVRDASPGSPAAEHNARIAAQAPESTPAGKANKQAAGAAKKTKKASSSAGSAGGGDTQPTASPEAAAAPERCENTNDMFAASANANTETEVQQ